MDYEVPRCTRHCAVTGRELAPGEDFFSALVPEGATVVRHDYAKEAWTGPPGAALGWWKSQIPQPNARRMHWAPNDVMLHLFEELQSQPDRWDMRYVLALLLVRRRVLRSEDEELDAEGRQVMVLYCPRRETTYRATVVMPDAERIQAIQDELATLLFSRAA